MLIVTALGLITCTIARPALRQLGYSTETAGSVSADTDSPM